MEKAQKQHITEVFKHTKSQEVYLFDDGNVFVNKNAADNYKRELMQDKINGRYKGETGYQTIEREKFAAEAGENAEDGIEKLNAQDWLKSKKVEEIEAENYKKLLDVAKDLGLKHKTAIKKSDLAALLVEQKKNLENVG